MKRRKFIIGTLIGGAGVAMGVTLIKSSYFKRTVAGIANTAEASYMGDTDDPRMWFEVLENNKVRLYSPKVEMGQGTFTSLVQIVADEMELDIDQIEIVHSPSSINLDGMSTGGSLSVSGLWMPLRELSATMREMLRLKAAEKMGLEESKVKMSNGVFVGEGQNLSLGETVADVTEWEIPDTPELKKIDDYKFIGKPVPRVDLEAKVFGDPIFGMDAEVEGMLYGSVVRPSRIGVSIEKVDTSKAEGMPGVVKVIVEEDFVGVIANSQVEAENAKLAIDVTWIGSKNWQTKDIEDMIQVGQGEPVEIQKSGDPDKVFKKSEEAGNLIVAEYKSPMGAHAQMEPNGALADVKDASATIYISTQVVSITRREVAERLGLEPEDVNIIPTYLGGGFGRRLHTPNAMQAAVLSKAVGKPVKCFFNRKEEFQNDTFRPPTHHVLKASLNEDGKIDAIQHNVSSGDVMLGSALVPEILGSIVGSDVGAWRGGMINYSSIPNYNAISWRVKLPFATSWWRSLGLLANTFAIESFMDELAIQSSMNPVDFRLKQIANEDIDVRLKKVIERAAKEGNYTDQKSGNRAMGFACSIDALTPAAHVVDVTVEDKKIIVNKVTCVMDCGIAVNPDQVKAQCEGSIIMGLSASLYEKMYVDNGELKPTIYGPYKMALMRHAPKEIDVILLNNIDKPMPVGEPPMGPIGAAIANAVFRITGQRLRDMPLQLA